MQISSSLPSQIRLFQQADESPKSEACPTTIKTMVVVAALFAFVLTFLFAQIQVALIVATIGFFSSIAVFNPKVVKVFNRIPTYTPIYTPSHPVVVVNPPSYSNNGNQNTQYRPPGTKVSFGGGHNSAPQQSYQPAPSNNPPPFTMVHSTPPHSNFTPTSIQQQPKKAGFGAGHVATNNYTPSPTTNPPPIQQQSKKTGFGSGHVH